MNAPRTFRVMAVIALTSALLTVGCACTAARDGGTSPDSTSDMTQGLPSASVVNYSYDVLNVYPHDEVAFTQGLAFADGTLYEGTGRRGESSLRKVDLQTGDILKCVSLPDEYFGEGVVVVDDRIVQLTWKAGVGLVYDMNDLRQIGGFMYDTEGWGVTYDGNQLVMSDGTSRLYSLDPDSFVVSGSVEVVEGGSSVTRLNELEYVKGLVFANVWKTDRIAMIDPADGGVVGWLDLNGLLESQPATRQAGVLNGIAYDSVHDRLFVTGKLWPWLFEIRLVPE